MIKTHKDIISILGGVRQLSNNFYGDELKVYQMVYKWKSRNRIPARRWREVVDIAQSLDIPLTYKMIAEADH